MAEQRERLDWAAIVARLKLTPGEYEKVDAFKPEDFGPTARGARRRAMGASGRQASRRYGVDATVRKVGDEVGLYVRWTEPLV